MLAITTIITVIITMTTMITMITIIQLVILIMTQIMIIYMIVSLNASPRGRGRPAPRAEVRYRGLEHGSRVDRFVHAHSGVAGLRLSAGAAAGPRVSRGGMGKPAMR